MPSSATPFLLPGNAWGQEDSLSSVASNDSGLNVPNTLSSTSSASRPSSATSSRNATRDSTIDNSSASRNNSASGNSNDARNGSASNNSNRRAIRNSATNNSSATNHLRRGRINAMDLHPPRNHNVRGSDAQVRNRMQTLAAPVEHHPRRSTRETRRQATEENSEQGVWITVVVSALLIGAFFLFPGFRRVLL